MATSSTRRRHPVRTLTIFLLGTLALFGLMGLSRTWTPKLGLDLAKTYTNVARVGNTGSASLAIALSEAVQRGLIRNGDTVVLGAVGAGFTFGASVWRWQLPAGGEG